METGEVIYEKVYETPRPPPKISLKHDWMKELGSDVPNQTNQIQTQMMIERGNPLSGATQGPRKVEENFPFSGDRNKFFS